MIHRRTSPRAYLCVRLITHMSRKELDRSKEGHLAKLMHPDASPHRVALYLHYEHRISCIMDRADDAGTKRRSKAPPECLMSVFDRV